jgi:hypothetical protein
MRRRETIDSEHADGAARKLEQRGGTERTKADHHNIEALSHPRLRIVPLGKSVSLSGT